MKLLLVAGLAFGSLPLTSPTPLAGPPAGPAPARVPVAVELFTSEGCSSCPAADAALRELEASQPVPGVEIVALGQHVDYWNRLGWKDAFSSEQFTQRQRTYAAGFGSGSYTPQAVINGRYELVGSQRTKLLEAIAQAARAPRATVQLSGPAAALRVQVRDLPAGTGPADVLLLITETGLTTQIGRGENAGRLVRHAAVVRELRPLGAVAADGTFGASPALRLPPQWQQSHLRAVVLVQERASHRVVGVGSLPLSPAG